MLLGFHTVSTGDRIGRTLAALAAVAFLILAYRSRAEQPVFSLLFVGLAIAFCLVAVDVV